MSSYVSDKKQILLCLKIKGQLKGIQKMVGQDKHCVDVLNQLYALIASIKKMAAIIMNNHIQDCARDAIVHNYSDDYVNGLIVGCGKIYQKVGPNKQYNRLEY